MNISATTTSIASSPGTHMSGTLKTETDSSTVLKQNSESATLTISAQGSQLANQQSSSIKDAVAAVNDTEAKDESATLAMLTESTSESSNSSTTDLSSLTENELNELLANGEISAAELAAELARRSEGSNTELTTPNNSEVSKTSSEDIGGTIDISI